MTGRSAVATLLLAISLDAAGTGCWRPDPAPSTVVFVASQAGAPFEGSFRRFSGHVCLDTAHPENGSMDIVIDTAAVDTGLPEFDDALRGADFFDSARWPTARFVSTGIRALGQNRYSVRGRFTLRDITREIEVPFALAPAGDAMEISGETSIKRLDYDIGLGEWRDTRWVGEKVLLRFSVTLRAEDEGVGADAPTP